MVLLPFICRADIILLLLSYYLMLSSSVCPSLALQFNNFLSPQVERNTNEIKHNRDFYIRQAVVGGKNYVQLLRYFNCLL